MSFALRDIPEDVKLACFDQVVWNAGFIDVSGQDPAELSVKEVRRRWVDLHNAKTPEARRELFDSIHQKQNLKAYDWIQKRAAIIVELLCLEEEERMEIFGRFCRHCGTEQPAQGMPCQCWNDE